MGNFSGTILSLLNGLRGEIAIVIDLSSMKVAGASCEARRLLGYGDDDILNLELHNILSFFRDPGIIGREKEFFSGEKIFSGFLLCQNEEIPIDFSLNLIESEGSVYGLILGRRSHPDPEVAGDTDFSLHYYKKVLDSIEEAIVVVDRRICIRLYNAPFKFLAEKYGYTGEMIGTPLNNVMDILTGKLSLEYKYVFQAGRSLKTSVKWEQGGKMLWHEVTKSPFMMDGIITHVVSVVRDITRQQELEEMKKESIFQIEKNMEQFAILNDHIRNPLQAIVGIADLEGGENSEKIIKYAVEIDDIVKELDSGWIESDKIREMLLRHYGLKVTRRPSISSPIGMLTVIRDEEGENAEE